MRNFLLALLVAVLVLAGLGWWSYRDAGRFDLTNANQALATVKTKLASLWKTPTPHSNQPIPILMYHYIRDNVDQSTDQLGYGLSVPVEEFRQQMDLLQKNHYHTVSLAQVAKGEYDQHSVVLTFDDGYQDFILEAYPILKSHNFSATTFIITERLTDPRHLSSDDVVFLANQGFEIGSHSQTHANLTTRTPSQLHNELALSQSTLSKLIDKRVTALSYPSGEYNDQVIATAKKLGYQIAVTTNSGLADPAINLMALSRQRVKRGMSDKVFLGLLH